LADKREGVGKDMSYWVRSVEEQVDILRKYFPDKIVGEVDSSGLPPLPEGAEGWFVVPNWNHWATMQYGEASYLMARAIAKLGDFSFVSYIEFPWWGKLCETQKKKRYFSQIYVGKYLQGRQSFYVIPAQLGAGHGGVASLGVFEVLPILLTHPERMGDRYCEGMTLEGDLIGEDIPKINHSDEEGCDSVDLFAVHCGNCTAVPTAFIPPGVKMEF